MGGRGQSGFIGPPQAEDESVRGVCRTELCGPANVASLFHSAASKQVGAKRNNGRRKKEKPKIGDKIQAVNSSDWQHVKN